MKKDFYLYQSGILKQQDYSLIFENKIGNKTYIPIQQVNQIFCFGEITFNKRVLTLLNRHKVEIAFFDYYGHYIGRYSSNIHKTGKLLLQQITIIQNERMRLYVAMAIQKSACKNMLNLIKYYQKKRNGMEDILNSIEQSVNRIGYVNSVEELRLLEASIKKDYYSSFDKILKNEEYAFEKRSKNPPLNPVNALLSYGYSLLYAKILMILDCSRLYPQLAFIHSLEKSSDPLQYDIADIFKPVIIDRIILRLIRRKQIKDDYFDYKEDGCCYLNNKGIAMFVGEYDQFLRSTVTVNGKSMTYIYY